MRLFGSSAEPVTVSTVLNDISTNFDTNGYSGQSSYI